MRIPRSLMLSTLVALLLLSGCNVFEGLYEGTTVDDADDYLQTGNATKAVELYEQALQKDPGSKPIKAKLSKALMQRDSIGVMDLLRIARELDHTLAERGISTSSALGKQASAAICSFDGDPVASTEQFFPRQLDGFDKLINGQETLERVKQLAAEILATTNPQVPTETYTVESLTQRVEDLLNEGELDEGEVATLLRNEAIALAALSYLNVNAVTRDASGNDLITFWHVTSVGGSNYVGYCAASQAVLDATLAEVACQVDELEQATIIIRVRADALLKTQAARDIADEAERGYDTLVEELEHECPATSSSLTPPML